MTSELLAALPFAVLTLGSALCLIAWRSPRVQRLIAVTALSGLVAITIALIASVVRSGPIAIAIGGWSAPIGITFRVDLLSAIMLLVAALIGLAVAIYALAEVVWRDQRAGFWPLLLLLVLGVSGAFVTGDLFNLFVWFEVMLIASFVLLSLGGRRAQLVGTHVYLVLSMIGSALFLIACGLVYATVQTLDLALVGERMATLAETRPGSVIAIEALLLVSFGLKAAVVPLMSWLPASYHTPLPVVSALFAALLTKVGVYAMIRIAAGVFPFSATVQAALVAVAALTMLIGVLGALAQAGLRKILGFHIVSQIGYMVAGLALASGSPAARRLALGAAIFYVVHHIFVKTSLFLIAGVIRRVRGTESLDHLGGVARSHPWLAGMFLISALSLAGVPPLSGFWAKLAILAAAVEHGAVLLVVIATVVGLFTLISMLKIWSAVFAGTPPPAAEGMPHHVPRMMNLAIGMLATVTIVLSVAPQLLFELALRAADQLIPSPPVQAAVLGGGT